MNNNELPKFRTNLPLTLNPQATVVHYVNALPGAGKTYQFLLLAEHHYKRKTDSILIYAAPTHKLLAQVAKSLTRSRIPHVIQPQHMTIPVGKALESFLSSEEDLPPGTILLVTHECIARADPQLAGKSNVCLVYDEARACLEDNYSIVLSPEVYRYLLEPQSQLVVRKTSSEYRSQSLLFEERITGIQSDDGSATESFSRWTWKDYRVALPTEEEILRVVTEGTGDKDLHKKKCTQVLDFLDSVRNSSLDVYVKVRVVKNAKKNREDYQVAKVFSPIRMFDGYGKVLILSAFFETSQMYHFLTSDEVPRTKGQPRLEVRDVTWDYINVPRLWQLVQRLKSVKVSYVYDLKGRSLTKTEMMEGVVVPRSAFKGSPEQATRAMSQAWKEVFVDSRGAARRPLTYREVYDASTFGMTRTMFQRVQAQHITALNTMMPRPKIKSVSVIRHMVREALKIQRGFLKFHSKNLESLPVAVNAKYRGSGEKNAKVWDQERLDEFNDSDSEAGSEFGFVQATKKLPFSTTVEQLSLMVHGRDRWRGLHCCAFLATMQYSRHDQEFLEDVAPGYDAEIDRTLDFALQVLFRVNARMAESRDPCLFIVSDLKLADSLASRFQELAREVATRMGHKDFPVGRVLTVLTPETWDPSVGRDFVLRYVPTRSKTQQREANAKRLQSPKGKLTEDLKKVWSKTNGGLSYNRFSAAIARAKNDPDLKERLHQERSVLQTFAQWRASTEGVRVENKLKTQNKSA